MTRIIFAVAFLSCSIPCALKAQPCPQEITGESLSAITFGRTFALSGDVAAIAASNDPGGGETPLVSMYRHDGVSWIEEQLLASSNPMPQQTFGAEVELDGDVLAVSTSAAVGTSNCTIFRYNGVSWLEEQVIPNPTGQPGFFGRAMALSGDLLIIGNESVDSGGLNNSGTAYVYRRVNGVWQFEAELSPPTHQAGRRFGRSVAIDEASGVAVVGQFSTSSAGSAWCFEFSGSTWNFTQELIPLTSSPGDEFGYSVSLSGDALLISAPDVPAAFAFRRIAGTWMEEQKLEVTTAEIGVFPFALGRSLELSGDTAILSTQHRTAVIFTREQGVWGLKSFFVIEIDGPPYSQKVALADEFALVSTPIMNPPSSAPVWSYPSSGGDWPFFGFVSGPEGVVACPGDPLSFSVQTGSFSSMTFQWQLDGEDIPGANAATIDIPVSTVADFGEYSVTITSACGSLTSPVAEPVCPLFIRGDANNDGMVDGIGDAIMMLIWLFPSPPGPPSLPCLAAFDADGNGTRNIADPIYLLSYTFGGMGPPPPAPFPDCGLDPQSPPPFDCADPACTVN